MAEDWRTQLQSDDPRVRAEAVKAIALSGDQANLPYLKEIAENDPDPRMREYAKKAARHLYTSAGAGAAVPERTRSEEAKKPEPLEKTPVSEPQAESPRKKLTEAELARASSKIQRALAFHMKGETQKGLKSFVQGLDLNPSLAGETFTKSVASELTGMTPDLAIQKLKDPKERKALLYPDKERPGIPAPPSSPAAAPELDEPAPTDKAQGEISLVQAWLSFFKMTEDFFYRIVSQANTEDTMISILVYVIASMVSFLISSFGSLQQMTNMLGEQLGSQIPDLTPFMLGILISMIFLTPISFFFGAGIQFLGLRLFKGSGTFKEHTYVLALITVPMTVLSLALTLPALIPGLNCVAGIAGFGLSIFSLVIMVRGMKVVHNLSTGQTIAGIIIPPLVLIFIGGCLLTVLGSALMGMLENMLGTQGGFPQY